MFPLHFITIARRECRSLLCSPLGYLVLFGYAVLMWYLYQGAITRLLAMPRLSPYSLSPLAAFFHGDMVAIALLLTIPTITMKLVTDEKSNGTYELLLTYPLAPWQLIAGKFLGVWLYYALLWTLSLGQILLIGRLGPLDFGQVIAIYLNLLLMSGGLLAIGLCASVLCSSQLAAFMTTLLALLPFTGQLFLATAGGQLSSVLQHLSVHTHLERACRGTLDSRTLLLFGTLLVAFLVLASQVAAARRWFPVVWPARPYSKRLVWLMGIAWAVVSLCILWQWRPTIHTGLAISLLAMATILAGAIYRQGSRQGSLVLGANTMVGLLALAIIGLIVNLWAFHYHLRLDISTSQAFTMDRAGIAPVQQELPPGDRVHVIAMLGYSEHGQHEHIERDNERYFLLQETLRKLAESLNRPGQERFSYEFVHPADDRSSPAVAAYVQAERQRNDRIAQLQNQYGVSGYRELLFLYRDRAYVVTDAELFIKKLELSAVPRLMVLWRKIYESGGAIEAPPANEQEAYQKLQTLANPEMLSIFPTPQLEAVLVNAILRVVRGTPWRLYFTQGAGEKWIGGHHASDYQSAYRLASLLRRYNFSLQPLHLNTAATIPQDCNALVILGTNSQTPITTKGREVVQEYLQRGGALVVFLSAESDGGLGSLLAECGIHTEAGIATQYYFVGGPSQKPKQNTTVDSEAFQYQPLDMLVRQWQEEENAAPMPFYFTRARLVAPRSLMPPDIAALPILPVSPRVFLDSLTAPKTSTAPASQSRSGPFSLGSIAYHQVAPYWKIAVIGNATFTGDAPFYAPGTEQPVPHILLGSNRFLVPALLESLKTQVPQVTVTTRPPIRFVPKTVPPAMHDLYFWLNGAICLAIGLIGIVIAWRA